MTFLSRPGTTASAVVCLLAVAGAAPFAEPQTPPAQAPPATQESHPQATSEVRPRMREHFAKGAAMRDAVIRADLEGVRAPAKWLAEHPQEDLPEAAQPNIAEMRRLAAEVAAAQDLTQAANGVARLAASCGACHTAIDVTPTLMASLPRKEDTTLPGHMRKHYRAADLLYRGLVVPSEHSWKLGADALTGDPVELELSQGPMAKPEIETLARQLHGLAEEAAKAPNTKARTEIYGRMLATCSDCHKKQNVVMPEVAGRG
jgi:hypothetical protein